jgi:hypothetical protein
MQSVTSPLGRPAHPHEPERRTDRGVTVRAVVIALVLIMALAMAGYIVEMVLNLAYNFNTESPPIAPLGTTVLIVLLNMLIARRWKGLSRRELLVIYAMTSIGAPVVAHGTLVWILSVSIGLREYARTMTEWQSAFFQYVPLWFSPTEAAAVDGYFQGQSSVPWGLWFQPLLWSGLFCIALYGGSVCLLAIFRRHWVSHERLSFPIAQVPLEAIRDSADGVGRFSPARAFWIGFGAVFALVLLARLATIFPSLPHIPLNDYDNLVVIVPAQRTGPLVGVGDFTLWLSPWCTALAYLIPKELSFSVWFFWYIRMAETVIAIAAGATPMGPMDYWGPEFPAPYHQGGGAVIALGILLFWSGRHYLRQVVRDAIHGRTEDDIAAPLGYRLALMGLALCMGYMVIFCMAAGTRLPIALLLVSLILAYHMVWARLRAENGMSFIGFPYTVGRLLQEPLGTAVLRPREVVTINALSWTYWPGWGEGFEVITGASLDALKISGSARIPQRLLLAATSVGFAVALVWGMVVILRGTYTLGFWNFDLLYESWIPSTMRSAGQGNYDAVTNPSHFSPPATIALVGGMGVTFLLAGLRARFWWWPLHPVGYLAANVWGAHQQWCPMFIGWLLKTLAIRYGGLKLVQKTMPAAIGAILADRLLAFVWPVVVALARR